VTWALSATGSVTMMALRTHGTQVGALEDDHEPGQVRTVFGANPLELRLELRNERGHAWRAPQFPSVTLTLWTA
jgi:hypothetical protein